MDELILHPGARMLLNAYQKQPTHALLLSGDHGVGLLTISRSLAQTLVDNEASIVLVSPEKGTITIDTIRQLYEQTRTIQSGRRCIIIDDAETMSDDAQNALLKVLEEPTEAVHFIITSHRPGNIVPTIISRTQHIRIPIVSTTDSIALLEEVPIDGKKQSQILFLADGRPAELTRLRDNPDYFSQQSLLITDARSLLQSAMYDRLMIMKRYGDREASIQLLATTARLLSFSVIKQKNEHAVDMIPYFTDAIDRITANGHVRTHLMHLVTKLS